MAMWAAEPSTLTSEAKPPWAGERRVDLAVEQLADLLLGRALELDGVAQAGGLGPVGVAEDEAALAGADGRSRVAPRRLSMLSVGISTTRPRSS